jgi:hypothetical protein
LECRIAFKSDGDKSSMQILPPSPKPYPTTMSQ